MMSLESDSPSEFGAVALVNRALTRAQLDYPSLADVSLSTESTPRRMGVAAGESTHGSQATADGVVAMLAALRTSLHG